jgi:hypothetical protein
MIGAQDHIKRLEVAVHDGVGVKVTDGRRDLRKQVPDD